MGQQSGESRAVAGRDASWAERHLGPGWIEVGPGIYRFEPSDTSGSRAEAPTPEQAEQSPPFKLSK
jgi:hypothetical protein